MVEQDNVRKDKKTKHMFRESIEVRDDETDDLKEIFLVTLSPYSFMPEGSEKTYKGHSLQITKTKISFSGSKKQFISLDPSNSEQLELINKAFEVFKKLKTTN